MTSPRLIRKKTVVIAAIGVAAIVGTGLAASGPGPESAPAAPAAATAPAEAPRAGAQVVTSAPGVVEPASRIVELRVQQQGRLATVAKEAGDPVAKGEVLCELDNDVERALVVLREAELARARAALSRVEAGARAEERERADCERRRADAALELSRLELARVETLVAKDVQSRHSLDAARAEHARAQAVRDFADAQARELAAGERAEVVAEARAEVARAEASLGLAQAQLERTRVRSPLDGRVVYRYREPGEVVGIPNEGPPVLTVAGGALRVRADVDARDIGFVREGQEVRASAPAYPGQVFRGRVVRCEQTLGRKNFRTDRPRERIDTKVLEVVCELEPGAQVPLGLELTVDFVR